MAAEKSFDIGVNISKPRKLTWEFTCGFIFYCFVFAQFVLGIAVFASKNSSMAELITRSDGSLEWKCSDGYVLSSLCAGSNSIYFTSSWGQCVDEDLCGDIQKCVAPGRRLRSLAEVTAAAPDHAQYLRQLAEERWPAPAAHMRHRQLAARMLAGSGKKEDVPDSVWDFFERHYYQPIVLFIGAFALSIVWLVLLRKAAEVAIWGTLIADMVALVVVIIWYQAEFEVINWPCIVLVVVMSIGAVLLRKSIHHAAVIMMSAMDGLSENLRIFAACFGVQMVWGLYFAFWIAVVIAMHFVKTAAVDRESSSLNQGAALTTRCKLESAGWVSNGFTYLFWILTYYWFTYFVCNINLMMITVNLSGWYFKEDGYRGFWVKALGWSLGPCAGANALCSGIQGLTQYLMDRVSSTWRIIFSVLAPWYWVPLCLALVLKVVIQTYTKFGLIAHTYSGNPFCATAPKAFEVLKAKLGEALICDYLGSRVMAWATYVIAMAVGFAAWAWADDAQGFQTFADMDAGLLVGVVILYASLLSYPFLALVLVILLETWIGDLIGSCSATDTTCIEVRARMNSVFASLFLASIAFFIMTYVSQVVVNAMDVIFFCFAVEADHSQSQNERFGKLYPSIEAQAGAKGNSAISMGTPVSQQMFQVSVPAGATAGTLLRVTAPNGVEVQTAVPVGMLPGQVFSVQVPEQRSGAAPPAVVGQPAATEQVESNDV